MAAPALKSLVQHSRSAVLDRVYWSTRVLECSCGTMKSPNSACVFESSFLGIQDNVLRYGFLSTLSGSCPPIGTGTLTMQEDGTLFRRHHAGVLTISGPLTAVPTATATPTG